MTLNLDDLKRPSYRAPKIKDAIRDAVANYLSRADWIPLGTMAIVDHVETSPDLKYADVLIRVFPTTVQGSIIAEIKKHIFEIQGWVNSHVRIRRSPRIRILLDDRGAQADKIIALFEKIEQSNSEEPHPLAPPPASDNDRPDSDS